LPLTAWIAPVHPRLRVKAEAVRSTQRRLEPQLRMNYLKAN
jgi:hypothetical protein